MIFYRSPQSNVDFSHPFSPPKIKPNFVGHEAIPEDEEPAQPIEEKHEDQHLAQHDEQHKKADDLSANRDPAAQFLLPLMLLSVEDMIPCRFRIHQR